MGIEVTFVDQDASKEELLKAAKPNTKAIFGETIANPAVKVLDQEKLHLWQKSWIFLFLSIIRCDSILCRPFEFGADIVIHSTTKYLDGHAVQTGGVIVDGGNLIGIMAISSALRA